MEGLDLLYMVSQSTWIIRIVIIVLLTMSVLSWALIFSKISRLRSAKKKTDQDLSAIEKARDLRSLFEHVQRDQESPSYRVAVEGFSELKRLKGIDLGSIEKIKILSEILRNAMRTEVRVQSEKLFGSLSFLATCASVAPLLGLFGTVWGIMHSFQGFRGLTTSSLANVAPGLAEALVTTALGLIVAIPAALSHNLLIRRISLIEGKLNRFALIFQRKVEKELLAKGDYKSLFPSFKMKEKSDRTKERPLRKVSKQS